MAVKGTLVHKQPTHRRIQEQAGGGGGGGGGCGGGGYK